MRIASSNETSFPNYSKEWRDSSDLRSVAPREVNEFIANELRAFLYRYLPAGSLS